MSHTIFSNLVRWSDCWGTLVLEKVENSTDANAEYLRNMAVRQRTDFDLYYDCNRGTDWRKNKRNKKRFIALRRDQRSKPIVEVL